MGGADTILDYPLRYPRLAALAAGTVSAAGFAPLNLWPLTLLALALLLWLVCRAPGRRSAFLRGWLFGLAHFGFSLNWIATAFTFQAKMPSWLGWVAVVLVALYLALYPALVALGAWLFARPDRVAEPRPGVAFVFAFAAGWIAAEWVRAWMLSGFAWNPLAVILVPPGLAAPAIWFGTYGLSGLVILLSAVVLLVVQRRWIAALAALAALALLFAVAWGAMIGRAHQAATAWERAGYRPPPPITVVQPNIGQDEKWEGELAAINFGKLAARTREDPATAEIMLWPEAAIPDFLESGYPPSYYHPHTPEASRARLAALLGPGDIMLLGALKLEFDAEGRPVGARNSVMSIDANGMLGESYDKSHLVPFGEYLPIRKLLEPIGLSRLAPGSLDFQPGPSPRNIDLGALGSAGIQICYEIIFSGAVVDPDARPDFIFNPSNDAWFGNWGPPQHLAHARLRAIEEGLPVVRATPTGISAVITADGTLAGSVPMHQAGAIRMPLPLHFAPTLFSRFGNTLPLLIALGLLLSAVAFARRDR